jgi:hypothetical protein
VFEAPGAGNESGPEAAVDDGQGSGDDSSEAPAEAEIPQEAEGRTPLTKDIKKQSEQFEVQRKEVLELFEDFGKQMGCGA